MIKKYADAVEHYADILYKINMLRHEGALTDQGAGTMMETVAKNLEELLPQLKHAAELLKNYKEGS